MSVLLWIALGTASAVYLIDKVAQAPPPSQSAPWQTRGATSIDTFASRDLLNPKRFERLNQKPFEFVDRKVKGRKGITHPTIQPDDAPELVNMKMLVGAYGGSQGAKDELWRRNRVELLSGNGANIL